VAEHLPYANRRSFRVEEMVDIDVETNLGRMPEFALISCGVLDGCSRPRNQRLYQKFLIP